MEKNLDALYQAGFEAVFISEKGICLGQNLAAEKIFGYSLEEALGCYATQWIADKDKALVEQKISNQDESPYQVMGIRKDGSEFPIEIHGRMITHENRNLRVTSILDVSKRSQAQLKIRQDDKILDSIFDTLADIFFLINLEGKVLDCRAKENPHFPFSPEGYIGRDIKNILPSHTNRIVEHYINIAFEQQKLVTFEFEYQIDKQNLFLEARICPVKNSQKLITIVRDITDKKNQAFATQNSELKLRSIFESSVVAIIVINQQDQIVEWNSGAQQLFGYTTAEAENVCLENMMPEELRRPHREGLEMAVKNKRLSKGDITHEVLGLRKNGEVFPISLTLGLWHQAGATYFSAIILDATERKAAEQAILHQAHYDALTQLPNRFLSLDRLEQMLSEAKRNEEIVAVLFLDLDDFKKVNDSLGHSTGDNLLVKCAKRLSAVVRECDTVGRLGGDEFIILLPRLKHSIDAQPILENIMSQFSDIFYIDKRELIVTLSIGIAIYPRDASAGSDLLRCADSAMYHAKNKGRNTFSFYTDAMNIQVTRRLQIEEQLHNAIERKEFEVYYQVQRDTRYNQLVGAEALIRWHSGVLGEVSPSEFIPIAEQSGVIDKIGLFMLEQSMMQLSYWQAYYSRHFKIAVNLSPRQFRDKNLVSKIARLMRLYKLTPDSLVLEITEGVLLGGHSFIEKALNELSKLDVKIAMDDFGTGYSSLNYLRKYPFDILKIDQSFIKELVNSAADQELVNATIAMSHALGLKVVAEGVETFEQLDCLTELGCDYVQGYLFSEPVDADAFEDQLELEKLNWQVPVNLCIPA